MSNGEKFEKIKTWKPNLEWDVAIEEMRLRREAVRRMGGKERIARHHSHDKMTIRERIERLVDKDTFFVVGSLMGKGTYDENEVCCTNRHDGVCRVGPGDVRRPEPQRLFGHHFPRRALAVVRVHGRRGVV